MAKKVIGAALGECVHVAGVLNFLKLAELAGWDVHFLGPAVPPQRVVEVATQEKADLVAVSYRLTAENGARLLAEFAEDADDLRDQGVRFAFGGTPSVAKEARSLGFFDRAFDGSEPIEEILSYLKGDPHQVRTEPNYPQTAVERIDWKSPYPILRHHFGLPTVEATCEGIERIAEARVLDVISLGTDQDAQASFFHPERQDPRRRGAGGVPVRNADDYRQLYAATRRGNYPLMRTYSGCDDLLRLAEVYVRTINIAWCAIPIFWFNQMDGRGPWDLEGSIREHQKVMAWYGRRHIPVELNEPHHWGLRDAPDVISVAAAYLSAYNARAFGVQDYICQMMFNCPVDISDAMDLAKMLAILDLIAPLESPTFRVWRQTRTGLLSYPLDTDAARAHLAASVYLQMALKPHIVHVVAHTEADHAAEASEVIEACKLARRAIENAVRGQPEMSAGAAVRERRAELVRDAQVLIDAVRNLADRDTDDPLLSPVVLARAVTGGLLDAPHLQSNPFARGRIRTRTDARGACRAVSAQGEWLSEHQRIASLIPVAEQCRS